MREEPEDAEPVVETHDDHAVPRERRAAVEVLATVAERDGIDAEPPTFPPPWIQTMTGSFVADGLGVQTLR